MKVDRFEVSRYSIPLLHPLRDATHGVMRDFAVVTVRIRTRDGLEGVGYTYTVGSTGGGAIASLIEEDLAPIVVGQDPRAVSSLWKSMWQATHYVGRGGPASFAISAVDIALWDIKAKAVGEPLWRLLGGHDPKVPAYASGIDLNSSMAELEQSTRIHREHGFRAIKMKVGKPRLAEDVLRVEAIRELLGPDAPLMVDANMTWGVHEALRASRALAEYDVYWLEEPTAPDDTEGYVRIQREGPVPIAAGENLRTVREFENMISAGAVAFPEPDATNCGGVTAWMKVANLAEARNLPVTSHGAQDLHVSLLAAAPNRSYLEIHGFELGPFLEHGLPITGGHATASERPGHGIEFRWGELRQHLVE